MALILASLTNFTFNNTGDGGVGKSSCTLRFISRDFSEDYDPTIEDSYTTTVTVDGQEYSIELLDTAGQEDYHSSFGETGVRDGDAFVCVYSIDRKESFDLLPRFLHRSVMNEVFSNVLY